MVAPERQGAPGQEQVPPGPLRRAERHGIPEAQRNAGNLHSCGRATGPAGVRVPRRQQVLRRPHADRQPELHRAAGRDRRHHRPERRRQVDAVQAARGQGKAGYGRGRHRPDREDGLRRPAPRRAGVRQDRVGRHLQRPGHHQRRQVPDGQPRVRGPLQLQRGRPAEEGRHAVGR
ncbi:hypothetical protein D3C72_1897480 [compost metagenome]